jgi:hypothetical protein
VVEQRGASDDLEGRATARIAPVDARSTTIELRGFIPTALSASASSEGLMVVFSRVAFTGCCSVVVVPETAVPDASVISIATPAVPCPVGAFLVIAAAMFRSAASEAPERLSPEASTILPAPGGTATTASFSPSASFGARIEADHFTDQPSDCL